MGNAFYTAGACSRRYFCGSFIAIVGCDALDALFVMLAMGKAV